MCKDVVISLPSKAILGTPTPDTLAELVYLDILVRSYQGRPAGRGRGSSKPFRDLNGRNRASLRPWDERERNKVISSMSEHIKHISDASFEGDVIKADKPVLLDFWAEWCGPCKMIAPILDEVAQQYGEKVQVAKLNVDENQSTPAKFGVRGIPTLILFKNGSVAAQKVGALSKSQLTAFLDSHL